MSTFVWSSHNSTGVWKTGDLASTGYTHLIPFDKFAEVPEVMEKKKISGVEFLAIVAHGDTPGVVVLEERLTEASLPRFAPTFRALIPYLEHDAKIAFVSCIAGAGSAGTSLLRAISQHVNGRRMIGFEVWGEFNPGFANAPGNVIACTGMDSYGKCWPNQRWGQLTAWGKWAKWVVKGTVLRYPMQEQNSRPGKRCANPACKGHANPSDQCPKWHPACEW